MSKELSQWLSDYDSGKQVESVSMGGISAGYEGAIQECALEIMRRLQNKPIPEGKDAFSFAVNEAKNAAADELDKIHGFSGAQVGAAANLASVFWRKTPEGGIQMMREQNPSRILPIQKSEMGAVTFPLGVD